MKSQSQDWVCINHMVWFLCLMSWLLGPVDSGQPIAGALGQGNTLPAPSTPFTANQPIPLPFYSYTPETPAPHTHPPSPSAPTARVRHRQLGHPTL